jgi:antitoxin component YwqK of YwqJK toxin-antitoxin module
MRTLLLTGVVVLFTHTLYSQKIEEGFDFNFKPTPHIPRYYVVTEKKDSLWYRQAWYLPERGMYMKGSYKDKAGKIEHGAFKWFYANGILQAHGDYVNGLKEGTWIRYNEAGEMADSVYYERGKQKGVGLRWHKNGFLADSTNFDGVGNGVIVQWYEDGTPGAAGYYSSDTVKKGRWQYFHENGKIKATEDYVNGERVALNCFDDKGNKLDTSACSLREAEFPGGISAWKEFIIKRLRPDVPVKNKAPVGQYTVYVQFIIDTDGSVSDIKPLTKFGYGMEEEVVRFIKSSPRWIPAQLYGKKVKAYRRQPITFAISQG